MIAIKFVISAAIIVLASEISKRSSVFGALIVSLPLVSMLSILWLYIETKDVAQVGKYTGDIFWLVLPSLIFFVLLPLFLRLGWDFWLSFSCATLAMVGSYTILIALLRFGSKL